MHRRPHPVLTLCSTPAHLLAERLHTSCPTLFRRLHRRHLNICIGITLVIVGTELAHSTILIVEISGWVMHAAGVSPCAKAISEVEKVSKLLEKFEIEL